MTSDGVPLVPDRGDRRSEPVNRATELLRELISADEAFRLHLGRILTVNATDLDAMSHLIAGGPLGPTELARRMGMSAAAVTSVVDRLESLGHARRERHATDRRAVTVVPSPASVGQALQLLVPMITGIDGVIGEFLPEQRETITRYLERVVEVYRAQVPKEPGGQGR